MNYYIFIRPLIGAGIGYVTNWIAVKMLFRPINPIKIGKFTLPFTPGIIPKNKERIAIAIGNSISENLLTEDDLKANLLSIEKKEEIQRNLLESINYSISQNPNTTIKDILISYIPENQLDSFKQNISQELTESIYQSIQEADLGTLISEQILIVAKEKLKGSLLGVFGGNSIIESMKPELTLKINEYINNNGEILINGMINKEVNKIENKNISEIIETQDENSSLIQMIMSIYEKIILEKLPSFLKTINISKIVSDKIISMPTLEVEKLILEIMKKELNALVNLGALIGFILGLINLLF